MKVCAREECNVHFVAKTHNQKYCSGECCKVATNARLMKKYYEKKARLNGKSRKCKCGARLSRYNPEDVCRVCSTRELKETTERVLADINDILQEAG